LLARKDTDAENVRRADELAADRDFADRAV
jgi:hypothetical protein